MQREVERIRERKAAAEARAQQQQRAAMSKSWFEDLLVDWTRTLRRWQRRAWRRMTLQNLILSSVVIGVATYFAMKYGEPWLRARRNRGGHRLGGGARQYPTLWQQKRKWK